MEHLDTGLRICHFLGLVMGFAASFSHMVIGIVSSKSAPEERAALKRVGSGMSKIGGIGLILLWASGLALLFRVYGGPVGMGTNFYVKMVAVVLLTILVIAIHLSERAADRGNAGAAARIPVMGKVAMLSALVALVFAVLAF